MKYMKCITELEFETKPNYSYLRNLFLRSGSQDGNIPICLYNMKESNENLTSSIFFERPYLRERKPCRPVNGEVKICLSFKCLLIKILKFTYVRMHTRARSIDYFNINCSRYE